MDSTEVFYYKKMAQLGVEDFIPVPGYEGLYEVSNLGTVRSLDRRILNKAGHPECGTRKWRGRVLKPTLNTDGYFRVLLCKEGHQTARRIHSLVAETFLGKRPESLETCHNNGNRTDNCLNNLRYDTPKNNQADRKKHNTATIGERNGGSKLTTDDVLEIKRLFKSTSLTHKEIGNQFGVCPGTIRHIDTGHTWSHVTLDDDSSAA